MTNLTASNVDLAMTNGPPEHTVSGLSSASEPHIVERTLHVTRDTKGYRETEKGWLHKNSGFEGNQMGSDQRPLHQTSTQYAEIVC